MKKGLLKIFIQTTIILFLITYNLLNSDSLGNIFISKIKS